MRAHLDDVMNLAVGGRHAELGIDSIIDSIDDAELRINLSVFRGLQPQIIKALHKEDIEKVNLPPLFI